MDFSLGDVPAKLILVHGTWGRGLNPDKDDRTRTVATPADPRWFESGSPFRKALGLGLSPAVQDTDITSFSWSGANSIEARQCAALGLAAMLDESTTSAPNVQHFIIAHSHGGNVAVAARQTMSGEVGNVHIITMATPFLSIRQPTPGRTDRLFAIALCIGLVLFAGYLTYLFLPFVVALLGLPYYLSKVNHALYATGRLPPVIPQHITNLKIIRGYRDEASLALVAGKITSSLAHIAGSVSILVPLIAGVLSAFLLFDVILLLIPLYRKYRECVQNGTPCFIPGDYYLIIASLALDLVIKAFRYLAVGFCVSAFLIGLAALCKSIFGRELLYRSLNATVDVHDSPNGSRSYLIDLCPPIRGSFFGLRHSLHSNPKTVEKIIAHIKSACSSSVDSVQTIRDDPHEFQKPRMWRRAVRIGFVMLIYSGAVAVSYAPDGAGSPQCALSSYLEPRGPEGGFAVLVARLENDVDGVGDILTNAITKNYGLHALRTCLKIAESNDKDPSTNSLNGAYNADLVISGKMRGKEIVLRVKPRDRPSDTVVLPIDAGPDLMAKRLQIHIVRAISRLNVTASMPAANLVNNARLDLFLPRVDWTSDPPAEFPDDLQLVRDKVGLEAKVGQVMLAAALTSHDGQWAKKAITHLALAKSIRDSSGRYKDLIEKSWEDDYPLALLTDARLNRTPESAQLAASKYLKKYQDAVAMRTITNDRLHIDADEAAAAFRALYQISHSPDSAKSSIRLSCESLLHWRLWQETYDAWTKRVDPLIKEGRQHGYLLKLRSFEKSDAYRIIQSVGKDPRIILTLDSKIRDTRDCEEF